MLFSSSFLWNAWEWCSSCTNTCDLVSFVFVFIHPKGLQLETIRIIRDCLRPETSFLFPLLRFYSNFRMISWWDRRAGVPCCWSRERDKDKNSIVSLSTPHHKQSWMIWHFEVQKSMFFFSKEIKEKKMFVFFAHLVEPLAREKRWRKTFRNLFFLYYTFFFWGSTARICRRVWHWEKAKDLSFLMQKPLLFGTHHELLSVIATKLGARSWSTHYTVDDVKEKLSFVRCLASFFMVRVRDSLLGSLAAFVAFSTAATNDRHIKHPISYIYLFVS